MARFTLPRDLYHGKGALEALKTLKGTRAMVCVGGGSMKRFGFLDKVVTYLKEAGMEVELFEGIEPDPSVDTVMRGAEAMAKFQPDWIVAIGGGSPIDAAKAMWIKYEYPDITFEEMCKVFGIPSLRRKAHFCAISSTSGTATEVTAFSVIVPEVNAKIYKLFNEGKIKEAMELNQKALGLLRLADSLMFPSGYKLVYEQRNMPMGQCQVIDEAGIRAIRLAVSAELEKLLKEV